MLSNYERQSLHDIQRQLSVDDPHFGRSFQALDGSAPAPATLRRLAYTAVIVVTAFLALLMLVAGSPGGGFVFGLIAGSARLAQYFHETASRQDGRL